MWLARFAPVLACLLTGCTVNGVAQCNGGGSVCWVGNGQASDSNTGTFFNGSGCREICKVQETCYGRVEAIIKYDPPLLGRRKVLEIDKSNVNATCVSPQDPQEKAA